MAIATTARAERPVAKTRKSSAARPPSVPRKRYLHPRKVRSTFRGLGTAGQGRPAILDVDDVAHADGAEHVVVEVDGGGAGVVRGEREVRAVVAVEQEPQIAGAGEDVRRRVVHVELQRGTGGRQDL